MNILNKLTKKNLRLNKKRTIVTIIGIILSTALICAVASMYSSGIKSLIAYEKKTQGDFHYLFKGVNEEDLGAFTNNRKVESIINLKHLGYAKLDESQNDYKPYAHIIGLNKEGLTKLGLKMINGRMPQNSHEILIPSHLRIDGKVDYKIGDIITLDIGKRVSNGRELTQENSYNKDVFEEVINKETKNYEIVGIIERPSRMMEHFDAPGYTFITLMDQNITSTRDIYVRYNKDGLKDHYTVTANILGVDSEMFRKLYEHTDMTTEEDKREQLKANGAKYLLGYNEYLVNLETNPLKMSSISDLNKVVYVVCLIIVMTSVFCIKNSFDISITEKIRQYGMLKSVGATSKQIRRNVYYEAFILGIIGIPLGILFGLLATYLLVIVCNYYLSDSLSGLSFIYHISPKMIFVSIVLSIITIYLSALRSSLKASRISPINAIRNSANIKIRKEKIKGSKLVHFLFGIGGDISYKNLKRNRKKYRTTVISIIVSVGVFIALSSVVNMTFDEVHSEYKSYEYNLVYTMEIKDNNVYQDMLSTAKLDNINEYSISRYYSLYLQNPRYNKEYLKLAKINSKNDDVIGIIGLEDESFKHYIEDLHLNYHDLENKGILVDKIELSSFNKEEEKTYRYNIHKFTYQKGDNLTFLGNPKREISIGYITDKKPFGYQRSNEVLLIVNDKTFQNLFDNVDYYSVNFNSNDADKLQQDIEQILQGETYDLSNISKRTKQNQNFFILIAIFLYGFIIVISLIGITNVFNTITTNMTLRKREFAMLKSVGMTRKEFKRMIRLESIFMGIKSLFFGIPIGIILSYIIYRIIEAETFISYRLPLKAIVLAILVVYLLITVIMHYSISKINKQNIIETIRNENI